MAQPKIENVYGRVFTNDKQEKVLPVFGRINQHLNGELLSLKHRYEADLRDFAASAGKGD